jgi:hypothetical protein
MTTYFGTTLKSDNLFWNYTGITQRYLCNVFVPPMCRLCAAYVTAL